MRHLTICGTPIADFTITIPSIPAPAEMRAAEFLRDVIADACGVTLPILHRDEHTVAHSIAIGSGGHSDEIKYDGFRMETDDANLRLYGNLPRAALYAAFDFAEKYLGYRYFADDCHGVFGSDVIADCHGVFGSDVIATEGNIEVPAGLHIIDNPVFSARRTTCHQHVTSAPFSAHCRLNDCMPSDETYGGQSSVGGQCHTFDRLCPHTLYFDEHPEYYTYWVDEDTGEGKRLPCSNDWTYGGQLCLTNPDVIRIVTENVLKELRANPDMKIVEVSQCDNRKYCQCERCAAVDEEEGSHAGTMIRFVNAVAEAVEKEFPDVLVRTFAYQYTRKPPKITKARHNVLVRYCTIEACFRHALNDPNCKRNGEVFRTELAGWGEMAHQVSIWDYITNWHCFNAPYPNLTSLRENARFFADNNAVHYFAECNPADNAGGVYPQLKAYLIGRLMWDPYMSEAEYERHIKEFLRAYYGKGWEEIAKYITMEHDLTRENCFRCFEAVDIGGVRYNTEPVDVFAINDFIHEYYVPRPYQPIYPGNALTGLCEHLDEAFALFDRAEKMAETETERFHIRRSRCSLEYTDLFVKSRTKRLLSPEERAAYEARVEQFYEAIKTYNFRLNVHTNNAQNR